MPPTSPAVGQSRPAHVVNEAIRAIVRGARGRTWTTAERALYQELVVEWETARQAEAGRVDVVEAA